MAYRKEEYEASDHEVTIQQVRGPDSKFGATDPSAWIDGYAAYADTAMYYAPFVSFPTDQWEALKKVLSYMVDNDLYFCTQCNSFYNYTDVSGTGFAGHICGDCARENATCPDNPNDDSHEDKCLNPSQKHNARVPTKYKCQHCGRKRETTPTG